MKKMWSIVLIVMLLIISILPVSAVSSTDESLGAVELSAKRFSGKILQKSSVEIADDLLRELGMPEENISKLPTDAKEDFADSVFIQKTSEYLEIDNQGEQKILSKKAYSQKVNMYDAGVTMLLSNQYDNLEGPWEEHGENDLIKKDLYIYKTRNTTKGTYSIIVEYTWKTDYLHYRGEEVLSLSGENLSFHRDSFWFAISYEETTVNNGKTTQETIYKNFDSKNLPAEDDLQGEANGMSFQYNLPNNIYIPNASVVRTNIYMAMIMSATLDDPNNVRRFNVYANYFHQTIGIGSVGVSVNFNGASVSVSPALFYDKYQIMTARPIEYRP